MMPIPSKSGEKQLSQSFEISTVLCHSLQEITIRLDLTAQIDDCFLANLKAAIVQNNQIMLFNLII